MVFISLVDELDFFGHILDNDDCSGFAEWNSIDQKTLFIFNSGWHHIHEPSEALILHVIKSLRQ